LLDLQSSNILFIVRTSRYPTLRNHNGYNQDRTPQAVTRSLLPWWWT